MKTTWNEKRIREEIARLDGKTGLNGISLPIIFSNAKCTLGQYISVNGGSFKFSNYYFQDPDWPIEETLDVIRHVIMSRGHSIIGISTRQRRNCLHILIHIMQGI